MTEIEAIYERHSVRSYKQQKIEPELLSTLQSLIDDCNAEGDMHIQLLEDGGNTFNRVLQKLTGLASAPSAIACVGTDDDTLDERAGYYGEKIVLRAQQLGLNTCWVGMYRKDGVPALIRSGERLAIVIALGYGVTPGKPHRSKSIQQLTSIEGKKPSWFDKAVEYAMLAPTAMNQQSFRILVHQDGSTEIIGKSGPYSKVDLGIVKYHFSLAQS